MLKGDGNDNGKKVSRSNQQKKLKQFFHVQHTLYKNLLSTFCPHFPAKNR